MFGDGNPLALDGDFPTLARATGEELRGRILSRRSSVTSQEDGGGGSRASVPEAVGRPGKSC